MNFCFFGKNLIVASVGLILQSSVPINPNSIPIGTEIALISNSPTVHQPHPEKYHSRITNLTNPNERKKNFTNQFGSTQKIFLTQNNFQPQNFFQLKKFFTQKFFNQKFFSSPNFLLPQ